MCPNRAAHAEFSKWAHACTPSTGVRAAVTAASWLSIAQATLIPPNDATDTKDDSTAEPVDEFATVMTPAHNTIDVSAMC